MANNMAREHSPGLSETVTRENGGTEQKMVKEHLFGLIETVTEWAWKRFYITLFASSIN